jgi:hypothetical protein
MTASDMARASEATEAQAEAVNLGQRIVVTGGDQVQTDHSPRTTTCAVDCWCHIGSQSPLTTSTGFYWDHRQYMDSMANRIRFLEVREGVVA